MSGVHATRVELNSQHVHPLQIHPLDKALLKKHFGIDFPSELAKRDVWPG